MSVSKEDYTEYDWFGEARVRETAGNLEGGKAWKAGQQCRVRLGHA
ncbi:MAG: hypothetical protein ACFFDR_11865 [Candidatus Thorarchaeota archaeon]